MCMSVKHFSFFGGGVWSDPWVVLFQSAGEKGNQNEGISYKYLLLGTDQLIKYL